MIARKAGDPMARIAGFSAVWVGIPRRLWYTNSESSTRGGIPMAEIIPFDAFAQWDLEEMDRAQLLSCLEAVRAQIAQLDEEEPADMESEAYDDWGDRHEELEDLADEIMEHLEALEGR